MKKNISIWWAFVFNPFVLLIYVVACSYWVQLAHYGGVARRLPVAAASTLLLVIWFAWCLYRSIQYKRGVQELPVETEASTAFTVLSKWWAAISVIVFASITLSAATGMYQGATEGKLSFYIDQWKQTRKVEYVHDNLYEDGIEGLFDDLEGEIDLPEDLYVGNEFDLAFNQDGQVTSLYTSLHGINDDHEPVNFLISYDSEKSNDLSVRLDRYAGSAYDEQMKLQPLLDLMDVIPVEEAAAEWGEETLGIYYAGVRDWGYNTDGIVSVEPDGTLEKLDSAHIQLIGYTVSVHAPENSTITPMRFIELDPELANKEAQAQQAAEANTNVFFLDQLQGYRLTVADAALGSRFYILEHTKDGGKSWETLNSDPFLGTLGTASGIVFLDDQLGFIGLAKSGGSYAQLYRTDDGGVTFERVELPAVEVPLIGTDAVHAPFDFPEMPYAGTDSLLLLVNQGQDGDHNGGTKALYRSTDKGKTWEYVEEVK